MSEEDSTSGPGFWKTAGGAGVVVFTIWLIMAWVSRIAFPDPALRGAYGDSFGFANSLFSALAFAGVIVALSMQMRELSLQRQELKDTRNELRRSAKAQEETEEHLRLSSYLAAVETLLRYHQDELKVAKPSGNLHPSRHAIELLIGTLESICLKVGKSLNYDTHSIPEVVRCLRLCDAAETRLQQLTAGTIKGQEFGQLVHDFYHGVVKPQPCDAPVDVRTRILDQARSSVFTIETMIRSFDLGITVVDGSGSHEVKFPREVKPEIVERFKSAIEEFVSALERMTTAD